MMDLKAKIAGAIKAYERSANTSYTLSAAERLNIADRILALPEIANGQALLQAKADEMHFGTGAVKIEHVPLSDLRVTPR